MIELESNEKIDYWWIMVKTNKGREIILENLMVGTPSDRVCELIDDSIEEELPVMWAD